MQKQPPYTLIHLKQCLSKQIKKPVAISYVQRKSRIGAKNMSLIGKLLQLAMSSFPMRGSIVRTLGVFGIGAILCSSAWAAQIVTVKPPGKNQEYVYKQATQLLAYWDASPRPEIRAVYGPKRASYQFRRITGVTIYAREHPSGKPVGIFVTLGGLEDSSKVISKVISATGNWKNSRNQTGTCGLDLKLHQNGTATGRWGENSFVIVNGRWKGNTVTWTSESYNNQPYYHCKCTLGNPITIDYNVPSKNYSGRWTSTQITSNK
jgi:hypothetical protein